MVKCRSVGSQDSLLQKESCWKELWNKIYNENTQIHIFEFEYLQIGSNILGTGTTRKRSSLSSICK
jgi:hypothetical protein